MTSRIKRLLFILTINKKTTIMDTKTTQEIFREKYEDILASLKELSMRYSNIRAALIIIIICTTFGILSAGNNRILFLIIFIFVIASTILELVSFFKNLRYLKENEEHLIAMEADLHYIANTKDSEEIKKLISFYDKLWRYQKLSILGSFFLIFI